MFVIAHHIADSAFLNTPLIDEAKTKTLNKILQIFYVKIQDMLRKKIVINSEFCHKGTVLFNVCVTCHSKQFRKTNH